MVAQSLKADWLTARGTPPASLIAMSHESAAVYLNDHLAGAQIALEVLTTLSKIDDAKALWWELYEQIAADRDELEQLMHALGIERSSVRRAAAWMTATFTELKVLGDDSSPVGALRRFELIEMLAIGIDGKRALWAALQAASVHQPSLDRVDYARLIASASAQRHAVEERRLHVATDTFAPDRAGVAHE